MNKHCPDGCCACTCMIDSPCTHCLEHVCDCDQDNCNICKHRFGDEFPEDSDEDAHKEYLDDESFNEEKVCAEWDEILDCIFISNGTFVAI